MRKALTIQGRTVFIVLSILMSFMLPAAAAPMKDNVGSVVVYQGKPTVDGVISEEEYAAGTAIGHWNMKALEGSFPNTQVPEELEILTYSLWDKSGLYLAFDVKDPTMVPTTKNATAYGDHIQILLDPGPTLTGQPLLDTELRQGRRASMYTVGVIEGNDHFWYRTMVTNEMVVNLSENPPASVGKITDSGWSLEMQIPWSMLMTDVNEKVEDSKLSADDFNAGLEIAAMFIYNDFMLDGNKRVAQGLYQTSLDTLASTFDWQPEVFGVFFQLSDIDYKDAPEPVESTVPSESEKTTESSAVSMSTEPSETTTQSRLTASGQEGGNGGDLLLILLIAVGVVAVIGAGLAIIMVKKRKDNK